MTTPDPLQSAIDIVGLTALARECKVSHQAVRKWQRARRMPRTEWTGETDYAATIARLTAGAVPKEALLAKWPPEQGALPLAPLPPAPGQHAEQMQEG